MKKLFLHINWMDYKEKNNRTISDEGDYEIDVAEGYETVYLKL